MGVMITFAIRAAAMSTSGAMTKPEGKASSGGYRMPSVGPSGVL
jgi:hypothetical protein